MEGKKWVPLSSESYKVTKKKAATFIYNSSLDFVSSSSAS